MQERAQIIKPQAGERKGKKRETGIEKSDFDECAMNVPHAQMVFLNWRTETKSKDTVSMFPSFQGRFHNQLFSERVTDGLLVVFSSSNSGIRDSLEGDRNELIGWLAESVWQSREI